MTLETSDESDEDKNTMTKTKTMTMTETMSKTFRKDPQRATQDTCDL